MKWEPSAYILACIDLAVIVIVIDCTSRESARPVTPLSVTVARLFGRCHHWLRSIFATAYAYMYDYLQDDLRPILNAIALNN